MRAEVKDTGGKVKLRSTGRVPDSYECRLEPYRVTFHQIGRSAWGSRVWLTNKKWYSGCTSDGARTLREAKEATMRTWIRFVLDYQFRQLCNDEGRRLLAEARTSKLVPAILIFADWLKENGLWELLVQRLFETGRKAGVKWPAGWAALAAEVEAEKSAAPAPVLF
jgi:hypothetical protein